MTLAALLSLVYAGLEWWLEESPATLLARGLAAIFEADLIIAIPNPPEAMIVGDRLLVGYSGLKPSDFRL